jgi:glycosyltransferase involved in cell wall biosynthesis
METNRQPIISIIVPCYNGAQYIRETLDCLQKQTIDDWECVIVNDGSSDNSLDILKEYAANDSRYKYLDKENAGPAIARNAAITASCGKYILPLDADDLIAPFYAEKAIGYLEKHPKCKVVYGGAEYFDGRTGVWELPEYSYDTELWENSIFCTAVYRRLDYDKTIGYNPNMKYGNEDWDFWLSLLGGDDEVYKIPETVLYYRKHGESRTSDLLKNSEVSYLQMILNHFDIYQPHLCELFLLRHRVHYLENELNKVLHSKKYKIGKYLLSPFRLFKKK